MRIYTDENVCEAALNRIRFVYDEFDVVAVCYSGGKDSSCILDLALRISKERGIKKTPVFFLDQEAEWQGTIDNVEAVMKRPDVEPFWLQIPFVMTNNASSNETLVPVWDENNKEGWVRDKHPISYKENVYGYDRFHGLFERILKYHYPDQKAAFLTGMRGQESPTRLIGMTTALTYKYVTWGKTLEKGRYYNFHPLYDWMHSDVWKYIHERKIQYNKIYDGMYSMGVNIKDMRISNLHHETSIPSLMLVQELEPDTWNTLSRKIDGVNTIKHIQSNSFKCPQEYPEMFESWKEYAFHLAKHMIPEKKHQISWQANHDRLVELYTKNPDITKAFYRALINTILSSDWDLTKLGNFIAQPDVATYRRYHLNPQGKDKEKNKWMLSMARNHKFLNGTELQDVITYFQND